MQAINPKKIQELIDQAVPDPSGKSRKLYRISGSEFLLQVMPKGNKSWCYRYTFNGRTRVVGLGPANRISYEEAGKRARKEMVLLDNKIDPLAEKDRQALQKEMEAERTFRACAKKYIADHTNDWKSKKHCAQWSATLETYAYPFIGEIQVADINVALICKVIEPIWKEKNETAERVRSRIEKVLGWATVQGYRSGDNPARWTGHLSELFPKRSAVRKVKHHPALPYKELPAFMVALEKTDGIGSWLLRFLILTCVRTTESRAAQWTEFDLDMNVWSIPAERMKAGRPHRVPLSAPVLEILRVMKELNELHAAPSKYVFNGQKWGNYPSEAIMLSLLKRMEEKEIYKCSGIVPHGFRSTFRDYIAEMTDFPREIAEVALAHVLSDKTEAAYQRGDYLEKRAVMMDAWAAYCVSGATA
jgi:integrase